MILLTIDTRMINSSGIGRYLRSLIPILIENKNLSITCIGDFKELSNFEWFDKVSFIQCRSQVFSVREQFELPIKIPKCDIFWSPQYNIPILPIRANKRLVTIHDVYQLAHFHELSKLKKIYVKIMMFFSTRLSSLIVTVSEFSKNEIINYTNTKSNKIKVIYNGIDEDFSNNYDHDVSKELPYILFVGNIKPHKNLNNALKAFRLLLNKYPDLKFIIIGQKEGLISGINNIGDMIHGIETSVKFTGNVTDKILKNYYANASLFFFPSKYEGFGLPILEAMKFYIPIISSRNASLKEVGGSAIVYCDPDNILDMSKKLESVLEKQITVSRSEYDLQLKKFNWKYSATLYNQVFESIYS